MGNLMDEVLNRVVEIQSDSLKIHGKLVAFSKSQRTPSHRPDVLVLEIPGGLCLVRKWTLISF